MVIVGSARIDENGHAAGGRAGDQTGRELSTQEWYLHSKGWRVFRARDTTKRERIADNMVAACNNPHIGYDQDENYTLWDTVKELGFDCSRVTTNCETDCARLVRVCCAYAGIFPRDFYTANEAAYLLETGEFDEYPLAATNPDLLLRGDILVTKTKGHTVVVLSNSKEFKTPSDDSFDGVFINCQEEFKMAATYKMPTIYLGSKGPHVAMVQGYLNSQHCVGEDGLPLKCDGDSGGNTMHAVDQYIRNKAKEGVDLGSPNGFGPLCYKSIGLDEV